MTARLVGERGDLAVLLESSLQVYVIFLFLVSSSSLLPGLLKSCSALWSYASVRKQDQQLTEANFWLSLLCCVSSTERMKIGLG